MSHIKISPSLLGLCGELRGSVRWRSSADVTFYWQAKSRERERAAPSSLPRGTSPTPPLVWEINVIGVAHQPASIWKEENEGKETRWFSPPGLVSSLWCTVATHTHTHCSLIFCHLSSLAETSQTRMEVIQCNPTQSFTLWFVLLICTSAGPYYGWSSSNAMSSEGHKGGRQ